MKQSNVPNSPSVVIHFEEKGEDMSSFEELLGILPPNGESKAATSPASPSPAAPPPPPSTSTDKDTALAVSKSKRTLTHVASSPAASSQVASSGPASMPRGGSISKGKMMSAAERAARLRRNRDSLGEDDLNHMRDEVSFSPTACTHGCCNGIIYCRRSLFV